MRRRIQALRARLKGIKDTKNLNEQWGKGIGGATRCVCVLRSASCSSGGDDDDVAMSTVVYIVGRV